MSGYTPGVKPKSLHILRVVIGVMLPLWATFSPMLVHAETAEDSGPAVIITEVLTGTKISGTQEFIELYNNTDQPIDLTGWQLWYLSAQASDQNKPAISGVITIGENVSTPVIAAHGFYILSGRSDYLSASAQQFYSGTMAATGGNLRLLSPNGDNPCALTVQDQIGWGNALYAWGSPVAAPPVGQSIARYVRTDGTSQDTYHNDQDFTVSPTPTPASINTQQTQLPTEASMPHVTIPVPNCTETPPNNGGILQPGASDTPPVVTLPSGAPGTISNANSGLVTPQITELLPNPATPQSDAQDEFIELYNSNATTFDLSGFALEVGLTTKHRYVFPAGTTLLPQSFVSFFSKDTGLSMSNTEGQVVLLDPFGVTLNKTEVYGIAKEGQVWAFANDAWYWSTTPTPSAPNAITAVASTAKKTTTAAIATAKKSTPTKASATAKPKTTKTKAASKTSTPKTTASTQAPKSFSPLHPRVLAVVALFALLYGLYEYRQDVANKFYQFRENRATRRAARAESEGG
jgi:hypothetical protein